MALIWKDSIYSCGHEEVDNQHKELFARINELLEAPKKGVTDQEVGKMLDFLGRYVQKHFDYEEQVMDERNCPAAAVNRLQHKEFIREFEGLMAQFNEQGPSLSFNVALNKKVIDWLNTHIKQVDAKLRETGS